MTRAEEIESIEHNIIYQNLRILVGNKLLEDWVSNKLSIIDYLEEFNNKLFEEYGEDNAKKIFDILCDLSVLLYVKYNKDELKVLLKIKENIDNDILNMKDSVEYMKHIMKQKALIVRKISKQENIIANDNLLEKEYQKRNEKLPLDKKIFSKKVLIKKMQEEINILKHKCEELNKLLALDNFIELKQEILTKQNKLKSLPNVYIKDEEDEKSSKVIDKINIKIQKLIEEKIIEFQKIFLECYTMKVNKYNNDKEKIKKSDNENNKLDDKIDMQEEEQNKKIIGKKQLENLRNKNIEHEKNIKDMIKIIYEFRYYCNLKLIDKDNIKNIYEIEELSSKIEELQKNIIKIATNLNILNNISLSVDINNKFVKNIFLNRIIDLNKIEFKIFEKITEDVESVSKDSRTIINKLNDKYILQIFDEDNLEKELEILNIESLIMKNEKKIKIFN